MKLFILFSLVFLSFGLMAQCNVTINPSTLVAAGGGGGYSLRLSGEYSEKITDALFSTFPKVKRKNFSWKFKNVSVPGIDELVTFWVYQGKTGIDTTGEIIGARYKGSFYFHTFDSYAQKEQFLVNKKPGEKIAINVYPYKGKKRLSKEEATLVEKYLKSLAEI